MTFAELKLSQPLLAALAAENYTIPTPIQARAIPPILEGKDVFGCAQTGTGKTAAFALPILQRLSSTKPAAAANEPKSTRRKTRALVLSPTRELAVQIAESFATYGKNLALRHTVIFGGVSQQRQEQALRHGVDVIVATPGRLMDLMTQGHVDLRHVEVFVLDEADRMLDMGFIHDVRKIAAKTPTGRQTLLFSATMPAEILTLAKTILNEPVKVEVTPVASTVEKIEQFVYHVRREHKPQLLTHLYNVGDMYRTLVFTRTKHGADRVVRRLNAAGIGAEAIHGNKSQNARQRALNRFKEDKIPVLVATDIAARGIDVEGITHVVNYDIPEEAETYVHRIGRTARAGSTGIAMSFCDAEEKYDLRAIEKLTKKSIAVRDDQPEYKAVDPHQAALRMIPEREAPSHNRYNAGPTHPRTQRQEGRSYSRSDSRSNSHSHATPRPSSHSATSSPVQSYPAAQKAKPASGGFASNGSHRTHGSPQGANRQGAAGHATGGHTANGHGANRAASRPHASKPFASKPQASKPSGYPKGPRPSFGRPKGKGPTPHPASRGGHR